MAVSGVFPKLQLELHVYRSRLFWAKRKYNFFCERKYAISFRFSQLDIDGTGCHCFHNGSLAGNRRRCHPHIKQVTGWMNTPANKTRRCNRKRLNETVSLRGKYWEDFLNQHQYPIASAASVLHVAQGSCKFYWAEARIKIARMTLTIKLDGNWNSFQLANNTPPLSVTGNVIAPSARMP